MKHLFGDLRGGPRGGPNPLIWTSGVVENTPFWTLFGPLFGSILGQYQGGMRPYVW